MVHHLVVWAHEDMVKLGVVLSVTPREPDSEQEWQDTQHVTRDRDGRIELNIISHFTLEEMLLEAPMCSYERMADVLALFFRNAILDALEHEIDECIFDGTERRFDPHLRATNAAGVRRPPFRDRGLTKGSE
jgi:hypothetical protein